MKRFFKKQLPAILLALTMMVSLVPAAMAVDCTLNGQEHTYGSWSVTTKPTCTDAGVQERICSVCGAKDTGSVEPQDTRIRCRCSLQRSQSRTNTILKHNAASCKQWSTMHCITVHWKRKEIVSCKTLYFLPAQPIPGREIAYFVNKQLFLC